MPVAHAARTTQPPITPTQSTTLVKNLFRAAFSTVAYIRQFFDDDCFERSKIGSTGYHKIVRVEQQDVKRFVDWLEQGVFDALQQKYLDVVLLEVYESEPSKLGKKKSAKRHLAECYCFNVSYKDGKAQFAMKGTTAQPEYSKEQVKRNTSEVLRSLVELAAPLGPLPANRILSMKLMYTKNTPAGYEPPLFRKATDDHASWFDDKPMHMEVGAVSTAYHQLSIAIRRRNNVQNEKNEVAKHEGKTHEKSHAASKAITNTHKQAPELKEGQYEMKEEGTTEVDVGDMDGNSARVAHRYVKETQELSADQFEDGQAAKGKRGGIAAKKRPRAQGSGASRVNGWGRAGRKRKTSAVEKEIEQKGRRSRAKATEI